MLLSEEATRRLSSPDYTPEARSMLQATWANHGEAFFWNFLDAFDQSRRVSQDWAPQLREFAARCRARYPLPDMASLSAAERARYQVFSEKIATSCRLEPLVPLMHEQVEILYSSPIGLLAAQDVLGPPNDSVVHLLEPESTSWFSEVYQPEDEAFWWYSFRWWSITADEDLSESDAAYLARNYPPPAGFSYWIVTDGHQWGPLAGGADHELWKWDGTSAEPIELFDVDTF